MAVCLFIFISVILFLRFTLDIVCTYNSLIHSFTLLLVFHYINTSSIYSLTLVKEIVLIPITISISQLLNIIQGYWVLISQSDVDQCVCVVGGGEWGVSAPCSHSEISHTLSWGQIHDFKVITASPSQYRKKKEV